MITCEVIDRNTKKTKPLPSGIFDVGKFCSANGIAFNDYCWEFACSQWMSSFDRVKKVFYPDDAKKAAARLRLACGRCPHSADTPNHSEALSAKHQIGDVFSAGVMCDGGTHHPSTSTIGVSAGAVSPVVVNGPHTGAGFFLIEKHGWLAGAGKAKIWPSFGGRRKGDESPWQTAPREMLEETGIPSEYLVSLAPPFYMRKDDHVYVLHIAMIRSTHDGSTFPMVTSQELTRFRYFTSFADAFRSELGEGEMVHRRDIEPAFLRTAAEVNRAISMRAQAASTAALQRPDSGSSSSAVPTSVSFADDASTGDELLKYFLTRFFTSPVTSIMRRVDGSTRECCQTASPVKRRGLMRLVNTKSIGTSATVTVSANATRSHACKHSRQQCGVRSTWSVTISLVCPTIHRRAQPQRRDRLYWCPTRTDIGRSSSRTRQTVTMSASWRHSKRLSALRIQSRQW